LLLKLLELLLFFSSPLFILQLVLIFLKEDFGVFLSIELDLLLNLSILVPQALIRSQESFVTLVNVFQFSKLIRVLGLDVSQELIEALKLPFLALDALVHLFKYLKPFFVLLKLLLFCLDVEDDLLPGDVVFFFFLLELLEVVRKFYQVVLDK